MKPATVPKIGWVFSMLLGLGYTASFLSSVLLPPEYVPEVQGMPDHSSFLQIMAERPEPQMIQFAIWALTALVGIGAVIAITRLVQPADASGILGWTSVLAGLGFAVLALDRINHIGTVPELAARYVAANETVQASMAVNYHLMRMDDNSLLTFGAVGLWLLVVNGLARRSDLIPAPLSYIGMVLGVLFVAILFDTPTVIVGAGAVLCSLVYFSWMGLVLRRASIEQSPAAHQHQRRSQQTAA